LSVNRSVHDAQAPKNRLPQSLPRQSHSPKKSIADLGGKKHPMDTARENQR